MDVGSALVGALVAAPLSGVGGTWLGAVTSRRRQRAEFRREAARRASASLNELREAYRRIHAADEAPAAVVVARREDELMQAAAAVALVAHAKARQFVAAGRAFAARLPGSASAETVAYDELVALLTAADRGDRIVA